MKTGLLVILLLFLSKFSTFGQDDSTSQNAFYIEAGGIGGFGSLNYERFVFRKDKFQIGVRLGLSTLRVIDYRDKFNPDLIIPIAVNFTFGSSHKAEIGLGNAFSNVVHAGTDLKPERETGFHGNLHIGYRYQVPHKGFFFRIGYTPIFEYFSQVRHWGGISFGLTF